MSAPRTLAGLVSVDGERVKGARFVAHATPLGPEASVDGAKARAAELKALTPDADHHGHAFRIGPDHPDFGWSDGGEPVGSAGRPILQRLDALGLLDALVVVSRLPGGQRLSATDLAHGYGEATRLVLAASTIVTFVPSRRLRVRFDYTLSGPVQGVLAAHGAAHLDALYDADVTLEVRVPSAAIDQVERALRDACAGRVLIERP